MKKLVEKYYGLFLFYTSVLFLVFAITNYLGQQKSDDSYISYHTESSQNTFVK